MPFSGAGVTEIVSGIAVDFESFTNAIERVPSFRVGERFFSIRIG